MGTESQLPSISRFALMVRRFGFGTFSHSTSQPPHPPPAAVCVAKCGQTCPRLTWKMKEQKHHVCVFQVDLEKMEETRKKGGVVSFRSSRTIQNRVTSISRTPETGSASLASLRPPFEPINTSTKRLNDLALLCFP